MNECDHNNVSWDDAPDYPGSHGLCMKWFGTCDDCEQRVYELWEPRGIKECES